MCLGIVNFDQELQFFLTCIYVYNCDLHSIDKMKINV